MKAVILDSDVLSEFFKGTSSVKLKMEDYLREFDFINVSIITYYEILNGLLYKDAKKQLSIFEDFLKGNKILPLTLRSVKISAAIRAEQRKKGIDIGHADILIAGTAIANEMQLVTNNVKHYKRINGLEIANWVK